MKKLVKKVKEKYLGASVSLWHTYNNVRASFFVENMGVTILGLVVIFGGGGLLIAFLKGWIGTTTTDTTNNGGINDNFGNGVSW